MASNERAVLYKKNRGFVPVNQILRQGRYPSASLDQEIWYRYPADL